jgi:anti-sigma factor RsiW
MSCSPIRERLAEFVYGDLTPAEAREVEEHIRSCPACRREHAALAGVRSLLDQAGTPAISADLPAIYRRAAEIQGRRARAWRRAGMGILGAAAAVLIVTMLLRLEVRADARQVVIRWGAPAEPQESPIIAPLDVQPAVASRSSSELQGELDILSELIQGLTEQQEVRDRRSAQDRAWFRAQLDELRRQTVQHWMATERDVAALCSTQLNQTPKGGSQ